MICKNCRAEFDKKFGVCPNCGYVMDEDFHERYDKTMPLENLIEGERAVESEIKNIVDENYNSEDENALTVALASDYIPPVRTESKSENNANSIIAVVVTAAILVVTIIVVTAICLMK